MVFLEGRGFHLLTDLHSLKDGLDTLSSEKQTVLPLNKLKMMINLWKARRALSYWTDSHQLRLRLQRHRAPSFSTPCTFVNCHKSCRILSFFLKLFAIQVLNIIRIQHSSRIQGVWKSYKCSGQNANLIQSHFYIFIPHHHKSGPILLWLLLMRFGKKSQTSPEALDLCYWPGDWFKPS